jgi:hypothetical protein
VQRQQFIEQSGTSFATDNNNAIHMLQDLSSGYGTTPRWIP